MGIVSQPTTRQSIADLIAEQQIGSLTPAPAPKGFMDSVMEKVWADKAMENYMAEYNAAQERLAQSAKEPWIMPGGPGGDRLNLMKVVDPLLSGGQLALAPITAMQQTYFGDVPAQASRELGASEPVAQAINMAGQIGAPDPSDFLKLGAFAHVIMNPRSGKAAGVSARKTTSFWKEMQDVAFQPGHPKESIFSDLNNVLMNHPDDLSFNPNTGRIVGSVARDGDFAMKGDKGGYSLKKQDFLDWLYSEKPFDPKIYGENIKADEEWVGTVNRLRNELGGKAPTVD